MALRMTFPPFVARAAVRLVSGGVVAAAAIAVAGIVIERTQLEVWIEEQYELTRRHSAWQQGEFANIVELSGARTARLRPVID